MDREKPLEHGGVEPEKFASSGQLVSATIEALLAQQAPQTVGEIMEEAVKRLALPAQDNRSILTILEFMADAGFILPERLGPCWTADVDKIRAELRTELSA